MALHQVPLPLQRNRVLHHLTQGLVTLATDTRGPHPLLITNAQSKPLMPTGVQLVDDTLYFLTANSMWKVDQAQVHLANNITLNATEVPLPSRFGGVPVQELCSFHLRCEAKDMIALDKSNDLYEFESQHKQMAVVPQ